MCSCAPFVNTYSSFRLIKASTTSMTSVPKPLKFMIPHFDTMKAAFEKMSDPSIKRACADVVSVLAMTMSEDNECLQFKMKGNTDAENIDCWGHEYVRHLSGEIVKVERISDHLIRKLF